MWNISLIFCAYIPFQEEGKNTRNSCCLAGEKGFSVKKENSVQLDHRFGGLCYCFDFVSTGREWKMAKPDKLKMKTVRIRKKKREKTRKREREKKEPTTRKTSSCRNGSNGWAVALTRPDSRPKFILSFLPFSEVIYIYTLLCVYGNGLYTTHLQF